VRRFPTVKAIAITADVADINSVNTAVEKALAEFGTIDILINNAGIAAFGKFLDLEPTDWERIIQVNLMERTIRLVQYYLL
jgi:3-oxoacyl-[acyl-carrier protein] reductase